MTSAPLISVLGLSKTYVEGWFRRRRLEVLKGLTLEVKHGKFWTIRSQRRRQDDLYQDLAAGCPAEPRARPR